MYRAGEPVTWLRPIEDYGLSTIPISSFSGA